MDARQILERHWLDHVDLTGDERGHTRRVVGDGCECRLGDIMFRLRPPVRVRHQNGTNARFTRFEQEGTGAVGVRAGVVTGALAHVHWPGCVVLLAPRLGHHVPDGECARQNRERLGGNDVHRIRVDLTDLLDGANVQLYIRAARALQGEDHIVGAERRAVLELDVAAQVETPHGGRCLLPVGGEPGFRLQLLATAYQPLVHVAEEGELEPLIKHVRIHGYHVTLGRKAEGLRVGGQCGERDRADEADDDSA